MSGDSGACFRPWTRLAALALFLGAAGCWNNVGVTCPNGVEFCNGEDIAVAPPADLREFPFDSPFGAPDLQRGDLLPPIDMATCAAGCLQGCCDREGKCHTPATVDTCGKGGGACAPCDPKLADNCSRGSCGCGDTEPCAHGQRCAGGTCVCDGLSCASGCCDANLACVPLDVAHCAVRPGDTCRACDVQVADGCAMAFGGGCLCGKNPACAPGQRCEAGTCVCDGKSCLGCCDPNQMCVKVPGFPICGAAGSACVKCDGNLADSCGPNNDCRCGINPACQLGQQCLLGRCTCTAMSCPNGCCANDGCNQIALKTCGTKGGACLTCDGTRADSCVNGACACGKNLQCDPGSICKLGACVCDAVTCKLGCCKSGVCLQPAPASCGVGGVACVACDPNLADSCGNGQCACGLNLPCGPGQRCSGGQCICDKISCPNGCCTNNGPGNNTCTQSVAGCGINGGACATCAGGQQLCIKGVCALAVSPCLNNTLLCVSNANCVNSCAGCQVAGRPSAACGAFCVGSCGSDCLAAPKTCIDVMGGITCVPDCVKCVGGQCL